MYPVVQFSSLLATLDNNWTLTSTREKFSFLKKKQNFNSNLNVHTGNPGLIMSTAVHLHF